MGNTEFRNFLTVLEGLDGGQRTEVRKILGGIGDFDRVVSILEAHFLEAPTCRHCGSARVQLWSREGGLKRVRCKTCCRTCNCLTGSPLARLRKKERWLMKAEALKAGLTVAKTAEVCGVAITTAFRWRHRFLAVQAAARPAKLEDVVKADETYFLESHKGQRGRIERKPRKRGGTATKRGLSDEQVPVLVVRDRQGNVLNAVLPDRSAASALAAFGSLIGPDNVLCIDDGRTLRKVGVQIGVPLRVIPKGRHSVPGSPVFHIQEVNGYHSRLKDWMRKFNGVATKNLQSYLGWRRLCENKAVAATPTGWMMALTL